MVYGRHALAGHLPFLYEVARTLAGSRYARDGLARALELIVQSQGWSAGVAWLADGRHLRYLADSVADDPALDLSRVQAFLESVRARLRGNDAAAGGVCSCLDSPGDEAWAQGAGDAGLKSAIILPLTCGGVTYGVIELFSCEIRADAAQLKDCLSEVADDLGAFLQSRHFETRTHLRRDRMADARCVARLAYWECSTSSWRLRGSANMAAVLGLDPDALPVTLDDYLGLVSDQDRAAFHAALEDLRNPASGGLEVEHFLGRDGDDGCRVLVVKAVADFDASGQALRISGSVQDITPYRRLEDRLRLAATAIDHAGDAIVIFDARGGILSTNAAFTRITGYTEDEVRGLQLDDLLNRPSGRHDESFYRRLLGRLRTFGRWKGELWACAKDGRGFAMLLSLSEIRDAKGRVSHHVGVFTDVSRQKEYKEHLEVLALHDSLTGLPNRALFMDRGQQALALTERNGTQVGLVFVDLDLFKFVNDQHGHAVGDEVLRQAGTRMRFAMRDCDTVARLGGDEFVVLVTDSKGEETCVNAAERLLHAITQPYNVDGIEIRLGASLGIAVSTEHGTDIDTLLRRSDQALYSIKRDDGRRYAVWAPDLPGGVAGQAVNTGIAEN